MNQRSIAVERLSKCYRIGLEDQRQDTFVGTLASWVRSPVKNYRQLRRLSRFDDVLNGADGAAPDSPADVIWALRDLSFEVAQGEVVGIVGRNGAGKSTLLKILSRITEPTGGRARIAGRVSSLLEVGTGFHPELTGRENTYLNGTILGMTKDEVGRKFEEIVEFSGVRKFIDTPVKRYSSGMRVRLAFSVAAHLEPEILLVDEVLAVGDAEFQKKCLGKMDEVSEGGRTVLFVSHNMALIQHLCPRAILLENGGIVLDGPVEAVLDEYGRRTQELADRQSLLHRTDRTGGDRFRFRDVEFLHPETLEPLDILISGSPVLVRLHYRCLEPLPGEISPGISFYNPVGTMMFAVRSDAIGQRFRVSPGDGWFDCVLSKWPLSEGRYHYNVWAHDARGEGLDWVQEAGFLDVEVGDYYGTGVLPGGGSRGVFVDFDFRTHVPATASRR